MKRNPSSIKKGNAPKQKKSQGDSLQEAAAREAFIAGAQYDREVLNDKFTQGYVCAVAALISTHGDTIIAKDVLRCNTPDDWSVIDEHDRDILAKVGLAPRRRKPRKASSVGRGGEKV